MSNNLLYYNIRSLLNKLEFIEQDIDRSRNEVHFVALTETKLCKREHGEFSMRDYRDFHTGQGRYGGVALYVHRDLKYCREIYKQNTYNVNMLIVSVPDLEINIGVIYKAPDVSMTDFYPILRRFLRECTSHNKFGTIIVGDMNINLREISENHNYLQTLEEYDFRVLNKLGKRSTTRTGETSSTIIDHVLTNFDDLDHKLSIKKTDLSDHKYIHITFD